jgi:hypothetical protein
MQGFVFNVFLEGLVDLADVLSQGVGVNPSLFFLVTEEFIHSTGRRTIGPSIIPRHLIEGFFL